MAPPIRPHVRLDAAIPSSLSLELASDSLVRLVDGRMKIATIHVGGRVARDPEPPFGEVHIDLHGVTTPLTLMAMRCVHDHRASDDAGGSALELSNVVA
jgi:hypothetical protein